MPKAFSGSHDTSHADQGQYKMSPRDDLSWAFPSPRAYPTFSASPVLKALVSKLPVASIPVDGFSHLFLHHEEPAFR